MTLTLLAVGTLAGIGASAVVLLIGWGVSTLAARTIDRIRTRRAHHRYIGSLQPLWSKVVLHRNTH